NGIAISPDQKTLYVADHNNGTDRIDPSAPPPKKGAMKVYAFPLGPDGLIGGPPGTPGDFGGGGGGDGRAGGHAGGVDPTAGGAPQRAGHLRDRPGRQGSGLHQDG